MNSDDNRGNYDRKTPQQKAYSPSMSYNYGHGQGYNPQHQHKQHPQHQQHPQQRRKPGGGGFNKGGAPNHFERIVKQNDIIIKLLKEILNRLPAPEESAPRAEDPNTDNRDRSQNQSVDEYDSDVEMDSDEEIDAEEDGETEVSEREN